MFGYISINKSEMRFREFDVYHSYYCGFCRKLKEKYGISGQLTLSYDMTFLIILLTGLYEPETEASMHKCVAHPFEKHMARINGFTDYVTDMNVLLSYYKCLDDWADERKIHKLAYGKLLEGKCRKIEGRYQEKIQKVDRLLKEISQSEQKQDADIDQMAGRFGEVMAEIFACRQDEWEESMRKIGFYLGKFIYLMDAYEDLEQDKKKGTYNPFMQMADMDEFEEMSKQILTMMMAECSREFEKLPILNDVEILRNILYSGVWCRYEAVHKQRGEKRIENHG